MDLWVVAAITGAGYAAKYLQNFSRDKEGSSGLTSTSSVGKKTNSPVLIPHFEENAAFLQKSAYKRSAQSLFDGTFGEHMQLNSQNAEAASTSGFEGEISDNYGETYEASARTSGGHKRGQSSIRSRHIHPQYMKPLNSLESCLMAQIYKEHSQTEDHALAPLPSPCIPALRPFVVTDGTRVISRPSFDSSSVQVRDENKKVHSKTYPQVNEVVIGGVPQLPERRLGECSKESNANNGKDQVKRLTSIRETPNEMQSSQGLPSGAALFCLGVSIGVTYNTLANNKEVTKLKDVLKQTENLVQDLQEELDMKDSLTVKELVSTTEDNIFPYDPESSIYNKKPIVTHFQSDSEVPINYDFERSDKEKAPENVESMNQIEAELEAELERLELNIKGSTLRATLSDDYDDDELDADIVAELVQGELRADILSKKPVSDPCDNSSSSSSTNPSSPKQGVSPRELTMRLHQVIQSRLEQRIMELEAALEESQKQAKNLESEQHTDPPSSSSSSSQGSPITIDTGCPVESQTDNELPLVMNLSGEALDAYNEAFEELNKINGSENDEEHVSAIDKERQGEQLFHRSMLRLTNQMKSSSLLFRPTLVDDEAYAMNCTTFEKREMFSFDEDEDDDDDTSLLIKQIVEKTRQGSSAILHAHRAMVSLDSNEK